MSDSYLEKIPSSLAITKRLAEIEVEIKILNRLLPLAMKAEEVLKEAKEDEEAYGGRAG